MILVFENDAYTRERETEFTLEETIKFKHIPLTYHKHDYDWYMTVALEKSNLVVVNRELLTSELLIQYRHAIREGYNHDLDKSLRKPYDYPNNRNSIEGIKKYIERISKRYHDLVDDLLDSKLNRPDQK